mgnify:CR=1 FL=1|tara:strand:- start:5531 stop:6250 length:720 start_codon:yes stop_codon:yes gene_type:complete
MEPQIIDYYNETPHGINVIDKLNEEYSELQSKYDTIKSYNNRYIAPIHIAKTFNEYKKYEKILNEEFPKKVRKILNEDEWGILAIYNIDPCPGNVYHKVKNNTLIYNRHEYKILDQEWFQDKLINELDNITKNKNRKWCEDRINLALEMCLSKYDIINKENNEKIIEDLIHHILNDNEYLSDFYIETIEFYTNENIDNGLELDFNSLSCLNCYHCEKCGILESYIEEEITMRCQDCLYI